MITVGKRIRIIGKTVKLLLQFRLFVHKIGNKSADSPVNHNHNHITAFPVQPEGSVFCFDPVCDIMNLSGLFLHAVDIDY